MELLALDALAIDLFIFDAVGHFIVFLMTLSSCLWTSFLRTLIVSIKRASAIVR